MDRIVDLVRKKRDGEELNLEEMERLINEVTGAAAPGAEPE